MACGTGACAVAVAANEAGLAPARVTVRFPGGTVEVERREDGEVLLTGPAVHVFDGTVDLERLGARMTEDLGRSGWPRARSSSSTSRARAGEEAAILERAPASSCRPPASRSRTTGTRACCTCRRARRAEAPLVLLAGHVDTVPVAGNVPGRRDGEADGRPRRVRHEGRASP